MVDLLSVHKKELEDSTHSNVNTMHWIYYTVLDHLTPLPPPLSLDCAD